LNILKINILISPFKNTIKRFLSTLTLSLISLISLSQIKSIGIPNIVNFPKQEYNASTQNWAIAEDKRGIMYFGNNDGVLEFDGVHWKLLQMPNSSVVRSITTDKQGTIYVGAFNEFGYLKGSSKGKLIYVSLVDKIPVENRNFGDIWKIYETENGIIFQSFSEIFLYKKDQIHIIAQKRDFHFSFYVNGELYITEKNKGLLKLKDEKLIPVDGGGVFNNNIWTMLPLNETDIIIGTSNDGLYLIKDNTVRLWNIPINNFLKQNQVYCATKVKDYFAIGTILNGVLIIDKNGEPVQLINRDKGLQNNTILSIYTDNYNNLWLGLDNGIDYVLTNSPFTNLVNESKIGAGYASYLYHNNLYLGTNQGLFYKELKELSDPLNENLDFKIVKNTQGQVWDLFEYKDQLFCGHNNGTYLIKNNEAILISEAAGGWHLFNIPDKENTMLQGTYFGIYKYENRNTTQWKVEKLNGFNESCRMIELYLAKNKYTLWISHGYKGIYKLDLNKNLDSIINLNFYNSTKGLETDFDNNVLRFNNEFIFSNSTGIYNFDEEHQRFVKNKDLIKLFGTKGTLRKLAQDKIGHTWFIQGDEMGFIKKLNDGSFKVTRTHFKSFAGSFVRSFEHLFPLNNASVIIATENGFAHFSTDFFKDIEIPFNALIRSIRTTNDSILFDGAFVNNKGHIVTIQPDSQIVLLPFNYNNIKIEYSSTYYENIKDLQYKYYLEGFEEDWSDWTNKTYKEYTNLKEGQYVFKVKAKNVFNVESDIAYFKFVISPPWYRSIPAYISYIIGICLIVLIIVFVIKKRIEREKRAFRIKKEKELLQQKISHKNEVLSAQQEIVKLRNEKLKIENEKNKAEVELKTKELASYAMQVTQKNETLFSMKEQLNQISQKVNPDAQKHLQKLIKKIDQSTNQKEDWEKFEVYFDQVYEDFTKKLRELYPNLTPSDIKLCAYLRMNLSTKEIAPLLNISIRGVEISRYRLRKKLDIPTSENLIDFMMKL